MRAGMLSMCTQAAVLVSRQTCRHSLTLALLSSLRRCSSSKGKCLNGIYMQRQQHEASMRRKPVQSKLFRVACILAGHGSYESAAGAQSRLQDVASKHARLRPSLPLPMHLNPKPGPRTEWHQCAVVQQSVLNRPFG